MCCFLSSDMLQKIIRTTRAADIENPNIELLCGELKKAFDDMGTDVSRAMIFVKQRATCEAVVNHIKGRNELGGIEAHTLFGQNKTGRIEGNTRSMV